MRPTRDYLRSEANRVLNDAGRLDTRHSIAYTDSGGQK